MKGNTLLRRLAYSSWILAVIPALILIFFVPALGNRYDLKILQKNNIFEQCLYADLNSDTITELISSNKSIPFYGILVTDEDQNYYDQWNIKDNLDPKISGIFFGNYDRDSFREIYVFSYKSDSLFLNVNEVLDPEGVRFEHQYIDKIGYSGGQVVSTLYPAGFYDQNGDGFEDLYFNVSSGFRLGPRSAYYFDLIHKTVKKSPLTSTIPLSPKIIDADNDHRPEIFGFISASGNYRADSPYSDSSSWLMVFNDQLEFEFPPVEIPGFANGLSIDACNGGYLALHMAFGTDTTVLKPGLMLYSPEGNMIKYRRLSELGYTGRSVRPYVFHHAEFDRIILAGSMLTEIDASLQTVKSVKASLDSDYYSYKSDINNDGIDELLLYSEDEEKLVVYNEELQLLAGQRIRTPSPEWVISHHFSKELEHSLFIKSGESEYTITMKPNSFYYLGYLTYPGIYFFFVLFIFLVRRIDTWQIVHREEMKQRLLKLQFMGIKAQLDPHFTYNSLNSIAALIYLQDKDAAYDYMNKFTRLLRVMVNDAERIYRYLGEEIEFVRTYLELEKLRFGEKFDYVIRIGDGISQMEEVPKLVLHTFAENAIKHGILPRTEGGLIDISINKQDGYLRISIEDNGVGRSKAGDKSTSTGKGLRLTGEFYDILNQLNKKPIRHIITDLFDESGIPSGTKVEVLVPLDIR